MPSPKDILKRKKWLKNISESKKGKETWNKGKVNVYSKETIKKMKESMLGKKCSFITKERMRKSSRHLSGKDSSRWQGGKSFEVYSVDWTETLRKSIRERDKYVCQLCSSEGNCVHHIDYDKKNCDPKNLVNLCKRCHNRTNSKREYWKKYFKSRDN